MGDRTSNIELATPTEIEEERNSIRDVFSFYQLPEEYINSLQPEQRDSLTMLTSTVKAELIPHNELSRRPLDIFESEYGTSQAQPTTRISSENDFDIITAEVDAIPLAPTVAPRLQLFLTMFEYDKLDENIKNFYVERYKFIPPLGWFNWIRRVMKIPVQQPVTYYALKKVDDMMREFFLEQHIYGDIKLIVNVYTRQIWEALLTLCWNYQILNETTDIELNHLDVWNRNNYDLPAIQREVNSARSFCTISGGKTKKPSRTRKTRTRKPKKLIRKSKKSKKIKKITRK